MLDQVVLRRRFRINVRGDEEGFFLMHRGQTVETCTDKLPTVDHAKRCRRVNT
jgi:hypothetical protein